jgi:hypothetical protein
VLPPAPAFAREIRERAIRCGHLDDPGHPVGAGVSWFGEFVAAKSGGKVHVEEFPSNTRGSRQQRASALQGGLREMQPEGMLQDDVAPAGQQRMRGIAKPVVGKARATRDPAVRKLRTSDVERARKLK